MGVIAPPQKCPPQIFCCDLKPHATFQKPRTTPSGRNVTGGEEKEEKEKNAINSGHSVP